MRYLCGCSRVGYGYLLQKDAINLFRSLKFFSRRSSEIIPRLKVPSTAIIHKRGKSSNVITQVEDENKLKWKVVGSHSVKERLALYGKLSKYRLSALVVLTASAGYAIAPGVFDPYVFAGTTIGTMLCSASANSFNQFMEVPYDCQMSRTRDRVLVRGLLRPSDCVYFGTLCGVLGGTILASTVNSLTATLGLLNIALYAGVYTPSKRFHIANTWIGSVVGSIPPLMGWAASTGGLDMGAMMLAFVLYSWQFPHFNALSWNYRPDYSRAGYKMMSVTDPALCRRVTLRHSLAQFPIAAAISYLGVASSSFFFLSLPLNAYLSLLAWEFYRNSNTQTARKLFRFTLLHLPVLMLLLVLTSWTKRRKETLIESEMVTENP